MAKKQQVKRQLHIGGKQPHPKWEIFDAIDADHVDHVGDAADLSRFKDGQFQRIYASHVLEHFAYLKDLIPTLTEWGRVLAPDGIMLISVPDLDVLCRLFLEKEKLTIGQRYVITRMMFGGQNNEYDFDYAGLNYELMDYYARMSGLKIKQRVRRFNLFPDYSGHEFAGELISLNVVLEKK